VSGTYPSERPLGARPLDDARVEFRVWAPRPDRVSVRVGDIEHPMEDVGDDLYEVVAPARAGDDYLFLLDGHALPDPCSRWQPDGLRGPSRVLEPSALERSEPRAPDRPVIYELHVGTFTDDGTFDGVIPYLGELASLGIGAIEIMPVAEFPGARGWGYDGVYISAAQSSYGGPLGLARLVAAAHREGLAVILDVVYNHVGASGVQALEAFGPYFTDRHETPWGRAIDYASVPVREWVLQSAEQWVREFGIDGLRLDAIHSIFDTSPEHIVEAIVRRVHSARRERALVIGEVGMADPEQHGAPACDAIWIDDFHHSLHVLLTGERDGYYAPFGRVSQLAQAFEHAPPERFVVYSQNHDQVGNRAYGDRLPRDVQPLAALCTLLSPFLPLLFMGEEYGEPAPFQFFSDHIDEEIAQATRKGRREEFASFAEFGGQIPDPQDPETFRRSKLTRDRDPAIANLYRHLLRLRMEIPPGDPNRIEFDEQARWLRVARAPFELLCNFGAQPVRLPCEKQTLVTSTNDQNSLRGGRVELAPRSGAVAR
jgi:maltooligosyltrehalose trehalohydrolase